MMIYVFEKSMEIGPPWTSLEEDFNKLSKNIGNKKVIIGWLPIVGSYSHSRSNRAVVTVRVL